MLLGGDIERIKEELQPLFTDVKNTVSSIQNLVNSLPKSSIKRIQRGFFSGGSQYSGNTNITISTVDLNKSILLIDRNVRSRGDSGVTTGYGKVQLQSNYIEVLIVDVPGGGRQAEPFYWQVIEFN